MENVFGENLEGKLESLEDKDKRNQRGVNRRKFLKNVRFVTLSSAVLVALGVGTVALINFEYLRHIRRIGKSEYEQVDIEDILLNLDKYEGKLVKVCNGELELVRYSRGVSPIYNFLSQIEKPKPITDNLTICVKNKDLEINIDDLPNKTVICHFVSEGATEDYKKVFDMVSEGGSIKYRGILTINGIVAKNFSYPVILGHSVELEDKNRNIRTFQLADPSSTLYKLIK